MFRLYHHTRSWQVLVAALVLLSVVLVGQPAAPVQAQPPAFTCGSTLYIMQRNPAELYTIDRTTTPFGLTGIGVPSVEYNGIGFNPVDNYIYGIDPAGTLDQGTIYQIDMTGTPTSLGIPAGWPAESQWYAGTFLEDGTYVVSNQTTIITLNVTTTPPTILTTATLTGGYFLDIAVNPEDGLLYGYNQDTQRVATVNPATGVINNFGELNPGATASFGTAFFDVYGNLFLYGSALTGGDQNLFYSADTDTGALTQLSSGPAVTISDGTSCPFGIGIEKTVDPPSVIAGNTVTYTYRIANQSDTAVTGVDFTDTMDDGRTFVAGTLDNPFGGTPNAYGGTDTLTITNMTFPANTIDTLSVDVQIPSSAQAGTVYNQAFLDNTPPNLDPTFVSDFPPTPGNPDETPLDITREVDLTVTKTESNDPVSIPGTLTYLIAVTNNGPSDASGVTLEETLTLPPGVTIDSITPSVGAWSAPTWTVGDLAVGDIATLTVVLDIDETADPGTDVIGDTVTVTGANEPLINTNDDTASATTSLQSGGGGGNNNNQTGGNPPSGGGVVWAPDGLATTAVFDLLLTKAGLLPGLGAPGEGLIWQITLTNTGDVAATNVVITDTLNSYFTINNAETSKGTASVSGQTVTFTIGTVNPGETVTLRIYVTITGVPPDGILSNTAFLTSDQGSGAVTATIRAVTGLPNTGYPPGDDE
jgi:uncharacterized repeat protein (TIGR01451 family)